MIISDIHSRIVSAGVTLYLSEGRLRYRAVNGVLDEQRKDFLRTHKAELIEYLSTHPELSPIPEPDHPPGSRAQIDQAPTYLSALICRIEALEAEYASVYGDPVLGELETCRELATKALLPAEQRLKYVERYEALTRIERLKEEHSSTIAEGRVIWNPGVKCQLLLPIDDNYFYRS
ncbi:MAG: hypothetical protein AB2L14_21145 [Candidatus Xenobiia bacterium LiM19]